VSLARFPPRYIHYTNDDDDDDDDDSMSPSPRIRELLEQRGTRQLTQAWLEQRSRLITASDVAALLPQSARTLAHYAAVNPHHALPPSPTRWANPWSSPARFLRDKADPVLPTLAARPLVWGTALEPVGRAFFERTHGQRVLTLGLQVHPRLPWLGASVDGVLVGEGEEGVLEIKCPFSPKPVGTAMPLHYWVQVQVGACLHSIATQACMRWCSSLHH
jgi:predicted phage-related endonuclease